MFLGRGGHAAEKIPAAHHQADLHAGAGHFGDLFGQRGHAAGVDAEGAFAGHHFTAEFQEDARVFGHRVMAG